MDEWVPIGEAAGLTGVHRVTIRRWVNRGLLKVRPGPHVRNLRQNLVNLPAVQKLAETAVVGRPPKPSPKPKKGARQ